MSTILIVALLAGVPQDDPAKPPSPAELDAAIKKGSGFLLGGLATDPGHTWLKGDELVLFALIHSDRMDHPAARKLLDRVMKTSFASIPYPTYNVAVRAMALAKLDPVKHQPDIARCAWWLINSQTDNGLWDYEGPTSDPPAAFERVAWPGPVPTGQKAQPALLVKRTEKWAPRAGRAKKIFRNTSTAQYAALGLLAAHHARVVLPAETWDRLWTCVRRTQSDRGGWPYIDPDDTRNEWWKDDERPGAPMTVSNLTVLGVLRQVMAETPPELQPAADRGFKFLGSDFPLRRDRAYPGWKEDDLDLTGVYFYYWLYGVERAGIFWIRETIGGRPWYAEGARELLAAQGRDGAWGESFGKKTDRLVCTAFALLFLKRAVPPPVVTGK
jgi:hypothetical protein